MTQRKKLIEVALPLEAINVASAREKSIRHGHPSTLHLWWARRPLAACRAVIFTSLVDDPDDANAPAEFVQACRELPRGKNATANDTPRQRLFDFIERLVTWEATTDEKILTTARELIMLSTDGNPPPLLDPFAGGGSIPLEAQRLGLEAHASDLNPVAVMINKALIEIPPKFANQPPVNPRDRAKVGGKGAWKGASGLAADVRYYGEWMRERAWERIGHLYPDYNGETVIAWLWARTVKCPNPACGATMPLIRSFDLSRKKGNRVWVEPQVDPITRAIKFEIIQASKAKRLDGTIDRRGATCLACNTAIPFDHIREEGKTGRIGDQLMAIVTEGKNGRNYYPASSQHEKTANVSIPSDAPNTELPEQALGFRVQLYGMTKHSELFTPRQLVALTTFCDLMTEVREQISVDAEKAGLTSNSASLENGGTGSTAYAEAISVYLTFILDKQADLGNSLNRWEPIAQCPRQLFARQTISMVWDHAEGNVFSSSSGSWQVLINNVVRGLESSTFSFFREKQGYARQIDAAKIQNGESLLVSTDPPYYDNIGYAALSDFFYIWMRLALKTVYPKIFGTLLVPKTPELIAEPGRFDGDKDAANEHFEKGLMNAFSQMRKTILTGYPLTVYYAFKQSELVANEGVASTGWETMLTGLIVAGFSIVGTWPMRCGGALTYPRIF